MDVKRYGFGLDKNDKWLANERREQDSAPHSLTPHASTLTPSSSWPIPEETLRRKLSVPSQGRLYYVRYALKMGWTIEQIHGLTHIDPWFLAQMKELTDFEGTPEEAAAHWAMRKSNPAALADLTRRAKKLS
ncbi:MAG: hypothetical protein ACTHLN_01930 [Tepidisphaeraceae bacterium]